MKMNTHMALQPQRWQQTWRGCFRLIIRTQEEGALDSRSPLGFLPDALEAVKNSEPVPFWTKVNFRFTANESSAELRNSEIFLKHWVDQIILVKMYIHAGRHKHLQQSEQGGLYSPCEWLSVSFVVVMWMGQMNAKGNEQRRAEGNRSGDSCICFKGMIAEHSRGPGAGRDHACAH